MWIDRIRRKGEESVSHALNMLPPQWKTTSTPDVAEQIVDRISTLQERVYRAVLSGMRDGARKPVQPVKLRMDPMIEPFVRVD